MKYGAGDQNRTDDLRITSALLYQLSYASSSNEPYNNRGRKMGQ